MITVWNVALYDLHVKHHGLTNALTGNSAIPNSDRTISFEIFDISNDALH
jgi:hypothetical protein